MVLHRLRNSKGSVSHIDRQFIQSIHNNYTSTKNSFNEIKKKQILVQSKSLGDRQNHSDDNEIQIHLHRSLQTYYS